MTSALLTLQVPARDVALVQRLFALVRDGHLPEESLWYDDKTATYSVECGGERVTHLFELIEAGAESPGAETYTERLVRMSAQQRLPFLSCDREDHGESFDELH